MKNTQKSPLTENQRKLIENNLEEIKSLLTYSVASKGLYKGYGGIQNTVDEALGYIPIACQEFNIDGTKQNNFPKYIARICLYRMIDDYRKNGHVSKNRIKRWVVDRIKKDLMKNNLEVTEEKIDECLVNDGKDPERYKNIEKIKRRSIETIKSYVGNNDKGFEEMEWRDLESGISRKMASFFNPKTLEIYRILLLDHILPKCQNKEYKTLLEISKQVGLTIGRLSQMVHSEKMKQFLQSVYNDELYEKKE